MIANNAGKIHPLSNFFRYIQRKEKISCTYMVAVVSLFQIAETIENVFSSWHKCFLAFYGTFLYLVEYCSSKNGHQLICCIYFCFFESFLTLSNLSGIQKYHSKLNGNKLWNGNCAVFMHVYSFSCYNYIVMIPLQWY